MRNLLESRIGKEVDVQCEGKVLSGKITRVEGFVLVLEKDEMSCFINIDKIIAFWDKPEKKAQSPGFVPKPK